MKNDNYKNLSKQLKSLGFINYDLRRNLSKGQKSHITKLAKQYHEVLEKPEKFQKVRLSKSTINEIKKSETPVITNNKYAIFHKGGRDTIKVKTRKDRKGKRYVTVTRIKKIKDGEMKFHQRLWKPGELEAKLNFIDKKIKANQTIQVRVGTTGPWKHEFTSSAELLKYLSGWEPKDHPGDQAYKSRLISEIQVMIITPKRGPRN